MKINQTVLQQYAIGRTLWVENDIQSAITRLGVLQADPIQAPARAHEQILRLRVAGYQAGDLQQAYPQLPLEEAFVQNYGYVPRTMLELVHPRSPTTWRIMLSHKGLDQTIARLLLQHGPMAPRQIELLIEQEGSAALKTRTVTNGWGGTSGAVTRWLEAMHWQGRVRVHRREQGQKIFAHAMPIRQRQSLSSIKLRADALVMTMLRLYAPLSKRSLVTLAAFATRSLDDQRTPARRVADGIERGAIDTQTLDGVVWCWPADESPFGWDEHVPDCATILAPFDPLVWDRVRISALWGWDYRFEAYTPAPKRKLGYYAHPLLWRHQLIGWVNLQVNAVDFAQPTLQAQVGFAAPAPRGQQRKALLEHLEQELHNYSYFMQVNAHQLVMT